MKDLLSQIKDDTDKRYRYRNPKTGKFMSEDEHKLRCILNEIAQSNKRQPEYTIICSREVKEAIDEAMYNSAIKSTTWQKK